MTLQAERDLLAELLRRSFTMNSKQANAAKTVIVTGGSKSVPLGQCGHASLLVILAGWRDAAPD
jgi:hypothetical protein